MNYGNTSKSIAPGNKNTRETLERFAEKLFKEIIEGTHQSISNSWKINF